MRRFGILCFNVLVGVAGATALALAARREGFGREDVVAAFLTAWWAGAAVGLTVGAGAVLGPRPPLPVGKCLLSQLRIAVSTLLGGFIGSLFPQEFRAADRAVQDLLARQGIVMGTGIGAAIGTAVEMIKVYRTRRRSNPKT